MSNYSVSLLSSHTDSFQRRMSKLGVRNERESNVRQWEFRNRSSSFIVIRWLLIFQSISQCSSGSTATKSQIEMWHSLRVIKYLHCKQFSKLHWLKIIVIAGIKALELWRVSVIIIELANLKLHSSTDNDISPSRCHSYFLLAHFRAFWKQSGNERMRETEKKRSRKNLRKIETWDCNYAFIYSWRHIHVD